MGVRRRPGESFQDTVASRPVDLLSGNCDDLFASASRITRARAAGTGIETRRAMRTAIEIIVATVAPQRIIPEATIQVIISRPAG